MDNNNPGMPADPNQGGMGGGMPQGDAPATPPTDTPPAPQAEEKCSTCGSQASSGNCVPCGQPTTSCTCPPASPSSDQGGAAAPTGM